MILGSQRFIIGVAKLEKCLHVLDCVISSIDEMFVRCRCAGEVIGISTSNILLGLFHLDMHRLCI